MGKERFYIDNMKIERFRKLKDLELNFGRKITVISGQNGVGKSNILSLLCSSSGTSKLKTYNNKNFQPEFYEYFVLSKDEIVKNQEGKYSVYITFEHVKEKQHFNFTKSLTLKDDTETHGHIRIIPRTTNVMDKEISRKDVEQLVKARTNTGAAARVPIASQFVSLARLFPIGESNPSVKEVHARMKYNAREVVAKYRDWYNYVFPDSISDDEETFLKLEKSLLDSDSLALKIKNTPLEAQSVGQDNLGSIVTSLINFYLISEEIDYNGGLLCIDELDVSLHPDAQVRLFELLNKLSDELKLQIVISSHSLTLIEKVINVGRKSPDDYELIYLKNASMPFVTKGKTIHSIKADLYMVNYAVSPPVKVYFEDPSTQFVHEMLLKAAKKLGISTKLVTETSEVALAIGKSILLKMNDQDAYFNDVCIILDGDGKYDGNYPNMFEHLEKDVKASPQSKRSFNIMSLPNHFPPEFYIFRIIYQYCVHQEKHMKFWRSMDEFPELASYTVDQVKTHLISKVELNENLKIEALKKVDLQKYMMQFFSKTDILKDYYAEDTAELKKYIEDFQTKIKVINDRNVASKVY
ncbi:ATP-dependent nuclease [Listeria booriae]|uniref:ATP-dependent nuclease n=1 Tax=Listeria booriae TaxID=1552123 RepID=UPI001629986C|nr:ATP-binding protein [Listeria booriae]MBC2025045.1 AAA family ATPase [Listeria booriae]